MAHSTFTVRFFAMYLTGMAAGLLFLPERVLPFFGFPAPGDFWVRVLGGLLGVLALYYFLAARSGNREFYRWTVWGRLPLIALYAGLVAGAGAPPVLLLFGVFESGCGLWTHIALRAEADAGAATAAETPIRGAARSTRRVGSGRSATRRPRDVDRA